MNKKDNKTEKKKGSLIGVVITVAAAMIGLIGENTEDAAVILIVIAVIVAVAVVAVYAKKGKEAAAKKTSDRMSAYVSRGRSYTSPVKVSPKANCDYGEDNCEYSHDEQRRIKQLNDFLKNGTIDREEYKVLLERYRKESKAAGYHKS